MKLSKRTWHYWIYSHTYPNKVPKNLCPYFWAVVGSCIMFIPLTIFFGCLLLIKLICSVGDQSALDYPIYFEEIGEAFLANIFCGFLGCMIAMWFRIKLLHDRDGICVIGLIGWMITILAFVGYGLHVLEERKEKRMYSAYMEEKPNIIIEFIKTKYKKMCPFIEWKD